MIKVSELDNTKGFKTASAQEVDQIFKAIRSEKNNATSGFYALPFDTRAIVQSEKYIKARSIYFSGVKNVVIIGIGGSSLGTRALNSLLAPLKSHNNKRLFFLEYTDPFILKKVLDEIHIDDTHFLVISKSGSTIETNSILKIIDAKFSLLNKHNERVTFITDKDSPLQKLAESKNIDFFTIAPNVGGRFSVLSLVGILPLMILGHSVVRVLQGAQDIMEKFFARKLDSIIKKAYFHAKNFDSLPMNVLFSYSSIFQDFNAWFIQLWGESLGKIDSNNNRVGPTPIAISGSIDQHSFLQLIVQGPINKSVSFLTLKTMSNKTESSDFVIPDSSLQFLESSDFVNNSTTLELLNAQALATKTSIKDADVPTDSIELTTLNERTIGALVAYFELLTACAGIALDINTYDQPGVESGKKILRELF